jgi:hypothetical protein
MELAQVASMGAEITEVATTCFIITLVVRAADAPPPCFVRACARSRALMRFAPQGLAIGFVLLRVESIVEGGAE